MNISNQKFEFVLKSKVRFGKGLTTSLPEIIREFDFERIGFIIDGSLYDNTKMLENVVKECEKMFPRIIVYEYRERFEPTYQFLDQVKMIFKENNEALVDCIVGIGGGSTIDSAKGIAVLATNHGPALNYRGFPAGINRPLPVIAVPSTAGTGTELVYNASFIDSETKVKMGINDVNNYPILVILDPVIVSSAPKSVAISSGCDALVHTLESFVSVKSNDITKLFSKKAFGLIINTLPKLIDDMDNLEYWARLQWGAYLAMVGLSNSTSGPAGALSYYLGTNFSVPHGIAGAVFIGKITRLNHELGWFEYAELYSKIDPFDSLITEKKKQSEFVVKAVEKLLEKLEIPRKLSNFGVTRADFSSFYRFAIETAKDAFGFNPIKLSDIQIEELLNELI